jgi:hypothetical protein
MKAENLYTPNCIRTVSGRYVNLVDPDPETFDIEDIAHALSNIPRFGGHLPIFYSVAHHSVTVARMMHRLTKAERFQGLMHDASEAYLLDIPAPLKAHIPDYCAIEERMMVRLAGHFGFGWPLSANVKTADKRALEEEWEYLMLNPASVVMTVMNPKERFLELYHKLKP